LGCLAISRYVGGLIVEWHAQHVPLADLNPRAHRKPLRVDTVREAPILLKPKATATVKTPPAPANALFGVIVHKVSRNPKLSGEDVTTDFLEFPVEKKAVKLGLSKNSSKPQ
jgi:hypothetical protein